MTAVDRPDNGPDALVWVQLPTDDVAFLAGFDPDRDRTASRADMVRVVEHLQAALTSGRAGAGEQRRHRIADELDRHAPNLGPRDPEQPATWLSWCHCGWDGGVYTEAYADAYRHHVADELLALLDEHSDNDQLATCSDRHADGDLAMYCEQVPGHVGLHVNHRTYW